MTCMNRITKEYIQDYVTDVAVLETEHRKGSSFYASASHTFTGKDIAELAESEIDASELLGITVTLNGYWSDYDGCEWDDEIVFTKAEEYEVFVPEVVIPAHYETKVREVEVVDLKFD